MNTKKTSGNTVADGKARRTVIDGKSDRPEGDSGRPEGDSAQVEDIRTMVLTSTEITEFQRRVYLELLNVPRGQTISYKELADRIGCRSAQAVGQALKRNPFAPDVPCHRVIASDGSIGGFHGQRSGERITEKRQLLQSEGKSLQPEAKIQKTGAKIQKTGAKTKK